MESVNTTQAWTVFEKKRLTVGQKKKMVCWFMSFSILATIIVSGMNSYSASFSVTFIAFLIRMRNENFNASYILRITVDGSTALL